MSKHERIKHTIYSDWWMFDWIDDEGFWEDVKYSKGMDDEEFEEEFDDDRKWEYMYTELDFCLDAEKANLNRNVKNTIIAIGDLGLWDGRASGYKVIGNRVSDCLVRDEDRCEWWCDAHDFRAKMAHHDGTNYILYRRRKDGISDYQWDNFLYMIYEGKATREHISKYTTSLLPYIAKVYGWKYHGKDVA